MQPKINEQYLSWYLKYAPKTLDEVVLDNEQKAKIKSWLDDITHLPQSTIFVGPPGIGKTTLAEMLSVRFAQLFSPDSVLVLQGSIYNKVKDVEEIILPFVKRTGPKLVRIEEFDRFSRDSQMLLRHVIGEKQFQHVKFLMTANYWRFIEPIESRSVIIELQPSKEQAKQRLKQILQAEKIEVPPNVDEILEKIVQKFYPRIRDMITALEALCVDGKLQYNENRLKFDATLQVFDEFKSLVNNGAYQKHVVLRSAHKVELEEFFDRAFEYALSVLHDPDLAAIAFKYREKIKQSISKQLELLRFFHEVESLVHGGN